MTSRERVHAAVAGKSVDRVPVFLWIEAHTGARLMARHRPSRHWSRNLVAAPVVASTTFISKNESSEINL